MLHEDYDKGASVGKKKDAVAVVLKWLGAKTI
jgi:hypothetical protein